MAVYLDAGTTYSKIITDKETFEPEFRYEYVNRLKRNLYYYILPSNLIKSKDIEYTRTCGHMAASDENEIIALANGAKKHNIDSDATILDLGSRDAKWIKFKNDKFHDMDWNTSCASSTGATVEMLMKFYDVKADDLIFNEEKFAVSCGIFGMEKIMDSISTGVKPAEAISKFVHGIAYNAWSFAKKPDKIYLSGGFCENKCFTDSLSNYCKVILLGRFVLCEGLM